MKLEVKWKYLKDSYGIYLGIKDSLIDFIIGWLII